MIATDIDLIEKLSKLSSYKKSKQFYAHKLGVPEEKINELWGKLLKIEKTKENTGAKILFLDIETSPLLCYVFQKQVWKAKISHDKVISNWFILTWSAKWYGQRAVLSDKLTSREAILEDDSRIVKSLWKLMDEADVICAHNGIDFDFPNILTRCVLHKLPPPSPYKQIDTKRIAKSQFGFTHNSLDGLASFFGMEGKIDTDFELWKRCVKGDEEALEEMRIYNEQDVIVLENVYNALRPYVRGHANLDLYTDSEESSCPACGKHSLGLIPDKYFYTQAVRYEIFRCNDCGAISRAKQGTPYVNKKKISAIPR